MVVLFVCPVFATLQSQILFARKTWVQNRFEWMIKDTIDLPL